MKRPRKQKASTPRKAVVEKAQQRKAKITATAEQTLIELVREDIQKFVSETDSKLQAVATALVTNQKVLADSHHKLDDQFAVLTRLVVSRLNSMIEKHNLMVRSIPQQLGDLSPAVEEVFGVSPVTYEEVNALFHLFDEFKKRPDFKNHFRSWYLGDDLSKLPPPPEPPPAPEPPMPVVAEEPQAAKEEAAQPASAPGDDDGYPEGAQIFGGDYAKGTSGNGNTETEQADGQADPVPQLQESHGHADAS
jgi:hypothetical protein